jgi:uncharacterized protein (TIRG00374 family)
LKRRSRIILFSIGFIVFGYLVWSFGVDNIIFNIRKTGLWFIPIISVWCIVYLLNTIAWYLLINKGNSKVGFFELFGITLSSFAINYITPVINLGGEPYRALSVKENVGIGKAVSSTIMYNIVHILSHFLLWITGVILVYFVFRPELMLTLILAAALGVMLFVLWFFFTRRQFGVFRTVSKFLEHKKLFNWIYRKLLEHKDTLDVIDRNLTETMKKRRSSFYPALALEYIARLIAPAEFYFIMYSIGQPVTIFDAIYIYAASSLILNILFFVPMEIGAREGSLLFIMQSLGLPAGIGIYAAIVNRMREFFWILTGLIFIQTGALKKKKKTITELLEMD